MNNNNSAAQPLDLDKLEALARAATPGPRTFGTKYVAKPQHGTYTYIAQCPDGTEDTPKWEADARFIAACDVDTILALIAQARASQQPSGNSGELDATGTTGASIDTPEFRKLLCAQQDAEQACTDNGSDTNRDAANEAWDALIAHIDGIIGDLRAQLASERQAKEYEQRHAAESETALAQAHAQLAAKGQGEPLTVEVAYDIKDAAGPGTRVIPANSVMRHADGHYTVFIDAPASAQPDRGAAQATLPDGWSLVRGGDDIQLHREDGKWCGYSLDIDSPAHRLTHQFLSALLAVPSPASQPVAPEAAPAMYQGRMRPMWRAEGEGWTSWEECTKDAYEDCLRVKELNDWQYEARALYTSAVAPSDAKDAKVPDHSEREAANAGGLCAKCNGTGVVDDGEIDCYPNGEPYMHGPVKCVKDCPECGKASQSPATVADKTIAAGQEAANAKDAARVKVLEAEIERYKHAGFSMSQTIHNITVGNQAAWIEWQHGDGAEAAMIWIHNGLVGPGLIPDEDEPHGKSAQAYADANSDHRTYDAAMAAAPSSEKGGAACGS